MGWNRRCTGDSAPIASPLRVPPPRPFEHHPRRPERPAGRPQGACLDRRRILNYIAGKHENLDDEPPAAHPKYDEVPEQLGEEIFLSRIQGQQAVVFSLDAK